jgi:amino acid adenylation domain-containing protein
MLNPGQESFDPFARGELSHTAPLTPEQEEIWLSIQFGGEAANLSYNEAVALTLDGELDAAALDRALQQLVARHEALRCSLSGDGREICVLKAATVPIGFEDGTTLSNEDRDAWVRQVDRAAVLTPFDLTTGPLVRVTLLRLGGGRHRLVIVTHHIICDGWSGAVLAEELGILYSAERRGGSAGLPLAPQLTDYARVRLGEESSPEASASHGYWARQFRDVPTPLDLPLDLPRPVERRFDADRIDVPLPAELVRTLRSIGAQKGASFVSVMLAAFQVFLHRISGQSSVVVAVPAAGQSISGMDALIGHCVRTLPVRADIDSTRPFTEHLASSRRALLDAMEHPQVTFGSLIKHLEVPRDPSRLPLVSVMFNVDPDVGMPAFDGMTVHVATLPRAYDNFEWFINAIVDGDRVTLETTFSTTLFDRGNMFRRMAGFVAMLESIAANPAQPIAELAVMPVSERAWVLDEINATTSNMLAETLVTQLLAHAAATPDRIAVSSAGVTLSYRELDQASAALAHELLQRGVRQSDHVGVYLSRSVDLLIALVAVMRAGAAYVPMDPEYPAERITFIASDSEIRCCVTDTANAATVPSSLDTVIVNRDLRSDVPIDRSSATGSAYVIYTSGSTGTPKGVAVLHENVANLLGAIAREPGLSHDAVLVAITTHCFDISVLELFLPLSQGAQVCIATEAESTNGERLAALLQSSGATHFQATPAGYRVLLESGWSGHSNLTALVGGEALPPELASTLRARVGSLWNCYGPTETTVWSTIDRVNDAAISIGHPIANTQIYILDAQQQLCAPGVTGELHIGGRGVSQGYWKRDALTAERFVSSPFAPDARLYRTGDLARLRYDGRFEWLGRSDFQVKVRGHRIELGEIQARVSECEGVREAVVIVRQDQANDQRIVAYVRPMHGAAPDEQAIRDALRQRLTTYMMPQHIVVLPAFPLTPNGKIDRKALPRPQAAGGMMMRPPESPVAIAIAQEMFTLLGVARIGMDDDFFALGGHSLLALRLTAAIRERWRIEMPLRALFMSPTLQGITDFVEAALLLKDQGAVTDTADQEEFVL